MVEYLYDGTFEGLLTCIYENYYGEKAGGIFLEQEYQRSLLQDFFIVKTEEEKARKVYKAIEKKISSYDLRRIYRVFLSNTANKETKILAYVKLGFKEGGKIASLHSNPVVFAIQEADKKVEFEVHRLTGLVRFSVVTFKNKQEGPELLYAGIEPDHDVVELLAPHFTGRFYNDPFLIHDKSRGKALVANQGQWEIVEFSNEDFIEITKEEVCYRKLWKQYFETMAIKERINPKCQKRCMPARYWKNLTEFLPD